MSNRIHLISPIISIYQTNHINFTDVSYPFIWSITIIYRTCHIHFSVQLYLSATRARWRVAQRSSALACGFRSDGRRFKSQLRLRSWWPFCAPLAKGALIPSATKCFCDVNQSMMEPPQRPSAGAIGHDPKCFAETSLPRKGLIKKEKRRQGRSQKFLTGGVKPPLEKTHWHAHWTPHYHTIPLFICHVSPAHPLTTCA